jgi:hypothetical protein
MGALKNLNGYYNLVIRESGFLVQAQRLKTQLNAAQFNSTQFAALFWAWRISTTNARLFFYFHTPKTSS